MAEESRALVRFTEEGEVEGVVVEVNLAPVVSAIQNLEETISWKLDEILKILSNSERFGVDQKIVDTAGTPVQLPTMVVPDGKKLTVQALSGNAGTVYWGGSNSEAKGKVFGIQPGGLRTIKVTNANKVWINADNDGDGVSFGSERD